MSIGQWPSRGLLAPWSSLGEMGAIFFASSVVHLLLLVPTLVTLQVYDRVLSSRRSETLLMLLAAAALALLAWWSVETSREHWHSARAAEREQQVIAELTPLLLDVPVHLFSARAQQAERDLSVLRSYLGGPVLIAFTDLPWSLIHLLVITAFHPLLGTVTLIGMLILLGLAWLTEWRLREPTVAAEQARALTQVRVGEISTFIEVLHAHGQQMQVARSLDVMRRDAERARLDVELESHSLKTLGKLVRQALQLSILAFGAWLVLKGQATGGVMIAGSILLGKALMPLEVLIGNWKLWLEARKAAVRLQQATTVQGGSMNSLPRTRPETALPACKGQLRARNLGVRAAMGGAAALHNLNLELPAGAMLVVLGESGSGKSTLARVFAGIQTPTQGEVSMDGAALQQYSAQVRGQATGYLPQDVLLHSGSIAHNIARQWQSVEPLTREQSEAVVLAARRAGAHNLITAFPRGYDTLIGQEAGAQVLSGGQRQRIALARAIYATPDSGLETPRLIVLDEPNSQLDAEGDEALERCLHGLRELGATVVAVTHRSHLIALASHVLLLRNGMVEKFGLREEVREWIACRNRRALKAADRKAAIV
ncbi:ATP-binding cassette, subfamily C, exporter for protease/lipase [Variovorax sp. YR750]|uniref:type I secretion system permease/ATPase n=1 Tax=Variovorax sp. YR750 TaxID=1884384 RepID=UPI0008C9C5A2|nr:ATP-binding cassette domain-containing protein [Variovorax sp. YR750]SEK36621.1 ATP-binding cassette, subfamily C, exporter for protease/lipase [Variovorax sp. YR750]